MPLESKFPISQMRRTTRECGTYRRNSPENSLLTLHLGIGLRLADAVVHGLRHPCALGRNGERMKLKFPIAAMCLITLTAVAAKHTDFSGTWELNAEKSKNIGMMAQMKMTQTIEQTDSALDVTTHTKFQGRDDDSKTHFDLTGKPVTNEAPMQGPSETVSKWEGPKLVTTWTSQSAVAGGAKVVRTETLSLSSDGKTMTLESRRGSSSPLVMVFDRSSR